MFNGGMSTSILFSFFSRNPVLGISLAIFVSLLVILMATHHAIIWNLLSTGNIYGNLIWEPFSEVDESQIDFWIYRFCIQTQRHSTNGRNILSVDRKIGFKSTHENQTTIITFKILRDGSIGKISTYVFTSWLSIILKLVHYIISRLKSRYVWNRKES